MLYVGGYSAGTGVGVVSGSVPGALLLGKRPEVLKEMNHQLQLWDSRLNEFNAVCKQNKVASYLGLVMSPKQSVFFKAQHAFFRWLLSILFGFTQFTLHMFVSVYLISDVKQ